MQKIKNCLVCKEQNFKILYRSTFFGDVNQASKYFLAGREGLVHGEIVQCKSCKFVFTGEQFIESEYLQIYQSAFRSNQNSNLLLKAEEMRGSKLFKIISKIVPQNATILDFGCGNGGFLNALPQSMSKYGFEVSKNPTHDLVDANIYTGNFIKAVEEDGIFNGEKFDLITACDVIEHLPNPNLYLKLLKSLLKPDGVIFITTPNCNSFTAKFFGEYWPMYLLEHLWFFSPSTLKAWAKLEGLSLIKHGSATYDLPISHIIPRVLQYFSININQRYIPFKNIFLPINVGLMYAIFKNS